MGESDTLHVRTEVIPPSPPSEHRVFLTPEEFTHSETIPEHSHPSHPVPEESPHHSVDHHQHPTITEESTISITETEGKHSVHGERGKAHP